MNDADVSTSTTNQSRLVDPSSYYDLNMRSGGHDYLIRIQKLKRGVFAKNSLTVFDRDKDETIGRKGDGEQSDHPLPM